MHLDPEAIFEEKRGAPGLRAAILAAALVANQLAPTPGTRLAVCALGLAAFALEGHRRARLLLAAGLVQAGLVLALARFVAGDVATGLGVATRFLAGLAWILWFSSTVAWPALKASLGRAGCPEALLEALDRTIAHALLLGNELARRRTAAIVRLGLAKGQPVLETYGLILAGGLESAIDRAARLEDARVLRAAPVREPGAAEAADPVVSLRAVSVSHEQGSLALDGIDLDVAPGEWVAVAGPSGAGKSSLLGLVAGVLPPSAGEARRFGVRLERGGLRTRVDRRVALVCQDPSDQLFGATPLDDIVWGLRRRDVREPEARDRAHRVLEELGICHLKARPPSRLSAGERKRAAFAAALAIEPELLLCDEPTSSLDPVAARRLVRVLERAAGTRRMTVLWITHDLGVLPAPVRRIVLLREGRVSFDGPLAEGLTPACQTKAGLALEDEASPSPPIHKENPA